MMTTLSKPEPVCSRLIKSTFLSLMLLLCAMGGTRSAPALGLTDDYEIVRSRTIDTDQAAFEVVAAMQRLAVADVIGPFFFDAIKRIDASRSARAEMDGIPISLLLSEYGLQHDVFTALSSIEPNAHPSPETVANSKRLIGEIDKQLAELTMARASPRREALRLRLASIQALAYGAVDPSRAMSQALDLMTRSLDSGSQDSRSFALSLHALAWAQMLSDASKTDSADTLVTWMEKARATFPIGDLGLVAAEIDVADKAVDGNRPSAATTAMRHAVAAFGGVPIALINVFAAKEGAELADDLKDPGLEYVYRLRFFTSLLVSALVDDDTRAQLLETYDPAGVDNRQITATAIKAALSRASSHPDASLVSSRLERELTRLLGDR